MCTLYFGMSLLSMYPSEQWSGSSSPMHSIHNIAHKVQKSNLHLNLLFRWLLLSRHPLTGLSAPLLWCFQPTGWLAGQITGHMTLLSYKQLNVPSTGDWLLILLKASFLVLMSLLSLLLTLSPTLGMPKYVTFMVFVAVIVHLLSPFTL